MKYGSLIIEVRELQKLKRIITAIPARVDASYFASINKFKNELKSAKTVNESEMPNTVVRFNSTVTVSDSSENLHRYQIVTPGESNIKTGKISIVAPMGLALFGYAEKDEVKWQFPGGMQILKIIKVEQETDITLKNAKNEEYTPTPSAS